MALIQGSGAFAPSQPYLSTTEPPRPCRRPRGLRPWTEAELATLAGHWFGLVHPASIAATLGRPAASVSTKAYRLGLPNRWGIPLAQAFPGADAAERNRERFWPNLTRRRCAFSGLWFWSDRRNGPRICLAAKESARYSAAA